MWRTEGGRPLRFIAGLTIAWVGLRLVVAGGLISGTPPPAAANRPASPAPLLGWPTARAALATQMVARTDPSPRPRTMIMTPAVRALPEPSSNDRSVDLLAFVHFTVAFANRQGTVVTDPEHFPTGHGTMLPPVTSRGADRWTLSAWALWRDGSGASAAPLGRLGGSQAGARLDFDLLPAAASRLSAYGRMSAALDRPVGPEAALGLGYQPSRAVPVTIAAERRIALGKGARNATALYVAGGAGPTEIGPALEVEGYGQAGIVGTKRRDAFADGRIALSYRLSRSALRPGISLSGGAQPGVARLDIGPALYMPVSLGTATMRLGAEWRERIAGHASPGSGLTLTLGAYF
ncbi:MAG: hypothetical protein ABW048_04105 [Sphingobium sp.]